MNRFYQFLIKWRIPILIVLAASLVPTGLYLPKLKNNNTIETFLYQDDPGLVFYRQTTEKFGGDHMIYLAVDAGQDKVFSLKYLQRLEKMTRIVGQMKGIRKVQSLTSVDAVLEENEDIKVGPLMKKAPKTIEEVKALEKKVNSSPMLRRLLSPKGRSTLMVAEIDDKITKDPTKENELVRAIQKRFWSDKFGKSTVRLSGNPVVAEAIETNNNRDTKLFSGLMLLLVAIFCALILRQFLATFLPVWVVLITVTWIMGIFVMAGNQTNWVTSIITPILLLVGVADAVHFLTRYQAALPGAESRRAAVLETLDAVTLPCLFTSITTALGFASLMVNEVMPVRTFGIFASIGVLLALLATLSLIPTTLSLWKGKGKGKVKAPKEGKPSKFLGGLDQLVQKRPLSVLIISIVVTLGLAAGVFSIEVETNLLKYFKEEARVVKDSSYIEKGYYGSSPLDIVVDAGKKDGVIEPKVLKAVDKLQDYLEQTKGIARGMSLADLVKELYKVMTSKQANFRIPDKRAAIAQLMVSLTNPDVLDPLVDLKRRYLRISSRFQGASMGLKKARKMLKKVEAKAQSLFPGNVKVKLTGSSVLFLNMDEYLVSGQIKSFGIMLGVLLVIMILLFRSIRVGLLAMIPNVVPIAVMLGLMGWLKMPLDGFTVMIASIAIGIGVDDTIHYLHHLRRERATGRELSACLSGTMLHVGRPVILTSAVLTLGFWIFCFSDFVGTRNFGFLTGITVLMALLADLLILPAMIKLLGLPEKWGRK